MGITIGPVDWWVETPDGINSLAISCPVATTLPDDSRIICKAGGKAWIVAPETTEVAEPWGNYTACGNIDNSPFGVSVHSDITSENFPVLYAKLISCGFNPSNWFVPCYQLLQNPGYVCRTNWDSFTPCCYWSSTECAGSTGAYDLRHTDGAAVACCKSQSFNVRAFRCVTY